MPFSYSEEQLFIQNEAHKFFTDQHSGDQLRENLDQPGRWDKGLWTAFSELGWTAITIPEAFGGINLSAIELCIIAEEMGRAVVACPYLIPSYGVSEAILRFGTEADKTKYLPVLASGESKGCLALLDGQGEVQPLLTTNDHSLTGTLSLMAAAHEADLAVVLVLADQTPQLVLLDLTQAGVSREVLATADNSRAASQITLQQCHYQRLQTKDALHAASHLLDCVAVPTAFEQIGGAAASIDMARDYALERTAFGQKIGKFQSIKHRIATMYSKNEVARGNALAAAVALVAGQPNLTELAACARLAAIDAYDYTVRESIEVHGAIGATWEMNCHLYYRRSRSLALELGSSLFWVDKLVDYLLAQSHGEGTVASHESLSIAQYRQQVVNWLEQYLPEFGPTIQVGKSMDDMIAMAKRWQKIKADNGYGCINLPVQYGGAGGTELQKIIFSEEERRLGLPGHYFTITYGMPIPIMLRYATETQKQALIPPAIRGENIWCQLFSEPAAGCDLAALRLKAERRGDDWILNGQKVWTSYAQYSDYGIVVARHDPAVAKHQGLTYFFVNMKTPGIEVRPIKLMSGTSEVNEVFFNDVVISDSCRLGAIGEGFKVAIETLMIERYAGMDEDGYGPSLQQFIDKVASARLRGRPALESDLVRHEIANAAIIKNGIKSIQAKALGLIEQGSEPGPEASVFKPILCDMRSRLDRLVMMLEGPSAMVADPGHDPKYSFQHSWLSIPTARIAGGTDETLLNTIAERILGLPQDHRPDKGVPFNQP